MTNKPTYDRFADIPPYREGTHLTQVPIRHLRSALQDLQGNGVLAMEPDFQRAHVWTRRQQEAFVEHVLRGGRNTVIRWNCPGYHSATPHSTTVLVDGKQRLTAILKFLEDEIPAFGKLAHEYQDVIPVNAQLQFLVNDLNTREEVLQWYLEINQGNVAHTEDELDHVRNLLRMEQDRKTTPTRHPEYK